MLLSTLLIAGKAVGDTFGAINKGKSAGSIAKDQKKVEKQFYDYNLQQVKKSYGNQFSNMMTNYAKDRAGLSEEITTVNSQLNVKASQNGVNLESSSIDGDMQEQLNHEYNTTLQDMLSSNINRASELVNSVVSNEMKLYQDYSKSISDIDQAVTSVTTQAKVKATDSLLSAGNVFYKDFKKFGITGAKDYFSSLSF